MSTKQIEKHIRSLRRYARALVGQTAAADALVAATIRQIFGAHSACAQELAGRLQFFQAFQQVWARSPRKPLLDQDLSAIEGRLQALSPVCRSAVLLTAMEQFSIEEAGLILGLAADEVEMLIEFGCDALERDLLTDIMIIEDSPLLALDLRQAVTEMGHRVVAVAATCQQAIEMAEKTRPRLVLTDIGLADGSSGFDAITAIQREQSPAVVYVTAFPGRLLKERQALPEFMVTKPFMPATLKKAINRALYPGRPHDQTAAQAG